MEPATATMSSFSVESSSLFPSVIDTTTKRYMTTIFTPSPACTARPVTGGRDFYDDDAIIMWDHDVYPGQSLSCSDPNRVTITDSTAFAWSGENPTYIVGVCPKGYTTIGTRIPTASSRTYSSYDSSARKFYSTKVAQTQAWCCPPGFSKANFNEYAATGQPCQSFISTSSAIAITSRDYDNTTSEIYTTTTSSFTIYDRGYFIKWDELQLPYFTPTSAPIIDIAKKSISSLPQSVTATPTPTTTSDSKSGGGGHRVVVVLSRGAIAGIVIGALVALGIIGACLVGCFKAITGKKSKTEAREPSA